MLSIPLPRQALAAQTSAVFPFASTLADLFGAKLRGVALRPDQHYFESAPPDDDNDKAPLRLRRDKRSDCVPVVIALIVTPDGFPLAYEVAAGQHGGQPTLRGFLHKIETQYGKAQRSG